MQHLRYFVRGSILVLLFLSLCRWDFPWVKKTTWIWLVMDASDSIRHIYHGDLKALRSFYQTQAEYFLRNHPDAEETQAIFFGDGIEIVQINTNHPLIPYPKVGGKQSQLLEAFNFIQARMSDEYSYSIGVWGDGQWSDACVEDIWSVSKNNVNSICGVRDNFSIEFFPCQLHNTSFSDVAMLHIAIEQPVTSGLARGWGDIISTTMGEICVFVSSEIDNTSQKLFVQNPGQGRFYFSLKVPTHSIYTTITAYVRAVSFPDSCSDNNTCFAECKIAQDKPKIWWVGNAIPDDITKYDYTLISPNAFLTTLQTTPAPQAIVLASGNAQELGLQYTYDLPSSAICQYIKHGGGLLILGEENNTYIQSDLEKISPVWFSSKSKEPLVLLFILDISGSMGEMYQGQEKITFAQNGILHITSYLAQTDYVGLLGFRSNAEPISPIDTWEKNSAQWESIVRNLAPYGSTNLASALQAAEDMLLSSPKQRRHVIIISDGMSHHTEDISFYTKRLCDLQVKISVICTGVDEKKILRYISSTGNGRLYQGDISEIYNFLQQELRSITLQKIQTGNFPITWHSGETIFVKKLATWTNKDFANVPFKIENIPLLTTGYYGLGRIAVWSSRFEREWLETSSPSTLEDILAWVSSPTKREISWDIEHKLTSINVNIQEKYSFLKNPNITIFPLDVSIQHHSSEQTYSLQEHSYMCYSTIIPHLSTGKYALVLHSSNTTHPLQQSVDNTNYQDTHYLTISYDPEIRFLGQKKLPSCISNSRKSGFHDQYIWMAIFLFLCERSLRHPKRTR